MCQQENMFVFLSRLNSTRVTALTLLYSSLYLSVFLSLPPPVCLCLCVICRHLRSGRGVVLVLLAVLHESGPNLIGWMSCDAVPASVQLVQQHFFSPPLLCFLLFFLGPCVCVYTCMHLCVCASINSGEAPKWRLHFMDERVGWLPVPSCTGIYQLIWVQRDWREGRKREMKKGCEAWPASSDKGPREVTYCFGETSGQHINKAGRKTGRLL